MSRPRVAMITTVPKTLLFFKPHLRALAAAGADVVLVSSCERLLESLGAELGLETKCVPMKRTVSPWHDARALVGLFAALRTLRPELVVAASPKAGVLAVVAARLAGVRAVALQIQGLPHTTAVGLTKDLVMLALKIACGLSDRVLCVSRSNAGVLVADGLCNEHKIIVPHHGSSSGVDAIAAFSPDRVPKHAFRKKLGIPADAVVIGFAGRLVNDKGCREMAGAWSELSKSYPSLHLVVAGAIEEHDPPSAEVLRALSAGPRVHLLGMISEMPEFMRMIDVLALPTYREGFPNVALEASAMEVPIVASRVPGCTDAVVDAATGTLVAPRDAKSLVQALIRYIEDPDLRKQHGRAGRARVLLDFRREDTVAAIVSEYLRVMHEGARISGTAVKLAHVDRTSEAK